MYKMQKIMILGDFSSGKSALIEIFINNTFTTKYTVTFVTQIESKTINFDSISVNCK